jgi:hypothetical protein
VYSHLLFSDESDVKNNDFGRISLISGDVGQTCICTFIVRNSEWVNNKWGGSGTLIDITGPTGIFIDNNTVGELSGLSYVANFECYYTVVN